MDTISATELAKMNETTRGLIKKIRVIKAENGDKLLDCLKENLAPEMVINKGTKAFPSLWSEPRKPLMSRNVTLRMHQRRKTIYTVAHTLYPEGLDYKNFLKLAKRIPAGTSYIFLFILRVLIPHDE